jgi:hypothetical protein
MCLGLFYRAFALVTVASAVFCAPCPRHNTALPTTVLLPTHLPFPAPLFVVPLRVVAVTGSGLDVVFTLLFTDDRRIPDSLPVPLL